MGIFMRNKKSSDQIFEKNMKIERKFRANWTVDKHRANNYNFSVIFNEIHICFFPFSAGTDKQPLISCVYPKLLI